jgi:endoglycosylceramidase
MRSLGRSIPPRASPGFSLLLLCGSLALAASCSGDKAPCPCTHCRPDGWSAQGGRIYDAYGRERILHGINVSNDVKSPPHDSWATDEDYQRLQRWGFSVVRMLTGWAAIMPTRGVIDEEYLLRLDQRVAWAAKYGINVILDMHQDIFGEGFGDNGAPRWACDEALYAAHVHRDPWYLNYLSPPVIECFRRFWNDPALQDEFVLAVETLARRYYRQPQVIGFDLFNEPYWANALLRDFHQLELQPFYERIMARLETVAPGYLYFVEPATTSQAGLDPEFLPFRFPNVVYAPHFYLFQTHDGHAYDLDPSPMRNVFASYEATAERLKVPWFLGEWAGNTDSLHFDQFLRDILGMLEGYHVGFAYYDYMPDDGGFSPLRADRSEKEVAVGVLSRVYPKAIGGRLLSYSFDDRTKTFEMKQETQGGVWAHTILAFPAERHYPNGWTIDSTDRDGRWSYTHEPEKAELSFTIDHQEEDHTITIRPK